MFAYLSKLVLLIMDIAVVNVAFLLSLMLRFDGQIDPQYKALYKGNYVVITLVMIVVFIACGLYKSLWRYASVREMVQLVVACVVGPSALLVVGFLQKSLFPRSSYIIYIFILTIFMIASRFGYRILKNLMKYSKYYGKDLDPLQPVRRRKRAMIVGAGEAASIVIKDLHRDKKGKKIVVVVDDDKNKLHANLHGVPVKGDTTMIPRIAMYYEVDEIIIAMPSASKKRTAEIIKIASKTHCDLKIFPGIAKSMDNKKTGFIRPVRIEDLLGRDEINLNNHKLAATLEGKTIMVTGGGGSIGSELCRQIVAFNPAHVVVFDIYENNAYDLQNELIRKGISQEKVDVIIGSVRDKEKLEQVFGKYKPHIVFHAAAHKHVPLMEANPEEAIKNNVFGTLNVAQCAIAWAADKFVMVSTDKAVNPTNVMGASKRICEMIIQAINETSSHTEFVAVRFGNVLGSNGSVIPLFKKQLEAGGPITVTHPDIIRYFMTIPEAVRLILEAMTFARGGEIFVLDMGEPVKIVDLAENLIRLSGLKVGKDIEIEYTGLRPGEKLYEELLMEEEGLTKTSSEKIYVAQPGEMPFHVLMEQVEMLRDGLRSGRDVREMLGEVVPTYTAEETKGKRQVI